jgi:hypothetical protein
MRYVWNGNSVDNKYFSATVEPSLKSFVLTIKNKTNSDLGLNWDKTLFISNGQTKGRFMIDGTLYKERNASKPSDIIFSGGTLSKTIWPNDLVYWSSNQFDPGWKHTSLPGGETGVYLAVVVDGIEINEKIVGTILRERIE